MDEARTCASGGCRAVATACRASWSSAPSASACWPRWSGSPPRNGYEATSVADILEEAGRRPGELLRAVRRQAATACWPPARSSSTTSRRRSGPSTRGPGPWAERARNGLAAMLELVRRRPGRGQGRCVVELAAIGPDFRRAFPGGLPALHQAARRWARRRRADCRTCPGQPASRSGPALARVYEEVVRGRAAQLPSLLPELTYELLVPFSAKTPPVPRSTAPPRWSPG